MKRLLGVLLFSLLGFSAHADNLRCDQNITLDKLNQIFNYLHDKDYVVVLCNRLSHFAEFTEFMMVDKTYILDSTEVDLNGEDEVEDYSQKNMDEILKLLGEEL